MSALNRYTRINDMDFGLRDKLLAYRCQQIIPAFESWEYYRDLCKTTDEHVLQWFRRFSFYIEEASGVSRRLYFSKALIGRVRKAKILVGMSPTDIEAVCFKLKRALKAYSFFSYTGKHLRTETQRMCYFLNLFAGYLADTQTYAGFFEFMYKKTCEHACEAIGTSLFPVTYPDCCDKLPF